MTISEAIGYLKGKSAIAVARQLNGRKKNLNGEHFWSGGYAVSAVGFEENKMRDYIRHQERLNDEEDAGRF